MAKVYVLTSEWRNAGGMDKDLPKVYCYRSKAITSMVADFKSVCSIHYLDVELNLTTQNFLKPYETESKGFAVEYDGKGNLCLHNDDFSYCCDWSITETELI